ncbi:2-amino-4-hydroxy-6-hydroxymethyldihydropteridine diphosphokinase [bacterium]|nr:2-amino-4-hydroxy-6-hydroxymethyldihydropteridine diphosphokinase [bacterium]
MIFIALGTNLGAKSDNLIRACFLLEKIGIIKQRSSVFLTRPWGGIEQPDYFNCVLAFETLLSPEDLLTHLKEIEAAIGRETGERWGPRKMDIDILIYNDKVLNSPNLTIPHPFLTSRDFYLKPLLEIAPDLIDPRDNTRLEEALQKLNEEGKTTILKKVEIAPWTS